MATMLLDDIDSVSSVDTHEREVLRPLPTPPPLWNSPYITRPPVPKFLPQPISAPGYNPTPYTYMNETASYVSMPGINGAESIVSESVKRDKTCACIVSHTYKQFKKLWDNPEKASAALNTNKMVGKFDPDIDRSTSSDTGSSDSDGEACQQKGQQGDAKPSTSSTVDAKRSADHDDLRAPPPRDLAAANTDLVASRQSFRMAMGNAYGDETLHVMGDF